MQKKSNALYKLGTYKLPSTNYSNKLIKELESHYYPVYEKWKEGETIHRRVKQVQSQT